MPSIPPHIPHPAMPVSDAVLRRRSADVGGLYLALRDSNHGLGWLDSSTPSDTDFKISTKHAVLLSTMHTETLRLLESSAVQNDPPELSHEDRVRLLKSIEAWYFEPLRMSEDEVFTCVISLFQVLFRIEGMQEAVSINFNIIPRFILHIRQLYRWQNHYHNFEHAVDVLQAIHCYLRAAGVVPPVSLLLSDVDAHGSGMWSSTRQHDSEPLVTCLTPREIFALYLAAIGHDVAHPGFNNPFMDNAEAPLSQVYENGSALEQMHSHMLLQTMRYHGMGVLLDDPETGQHFRRILRGSVLATDMGVHNDFMNKFAKLLETWSGTVDWQAAKFERQEFICKLLLKNADISNPSRPFLVSQQWSSALQQEWACQYKFENYLELTHSVNPSNGEVAEANSQVFFTGKIAKPLVDMTAIAIPELRQYSYYCAENLREWEHRLKKAKDKSSAAAATNFTSPIAPPLSPPHTSSASPRLNNTIITPNYPTFTTSSLRSQTTTTTTAAVTTTLPSQSLTPPISIPPPILSPSTTIAVPTTTTPSSLSSSSNPVSPRILNPTSDNDYSGVFRLTRPKGSSSSTTSPSATPSSGFGMSGSSGGGGGGARAGQISRTPSSNESGGGGGSGGGFVGGINGASSVVAGNPDILPSLSRAAARVIAGTPSRTTGAGVVGLGGGTSNVGTATATAGAGAGGTTTGGGGSSEGSVTLLPSAVEPPRQFLPRSLMYPHPIRYVRQPVQQQYLQHQRQQQQQQSNQDSELEQSQIQSPPPNTPSYSSTPYQLEEYEGMNNGTPSSEIEITTTTTTSSAGGVGIARGGNDNSNNGNVDEDTVFEREVEQRHQGFKRAVERGIGVGSLKKRKSSGNILSGTPPTTTTTSSGGGNTAAAATGSVGTGAGAGSAMSGLNSDLVGGSVPPSPHGVGGGSGCNTTTAATTTTTTGNHHHQSRASWCSGDSRPISLGTAGAFEEWRGRWGGVDGHGHAGGTSKAVASEEGSGAEDDTGDEEKKESRRAVEDNGSGESESGCSESEDSKQEEEEEEAEEEEEEEEETSSSSIPAGLVSAAPIVKSSSGTTISTLNPQTPPRQTSNQHSSTTTQITDEYRSGSPTPRAKDKMRMKMEGSDVKKRKEEEEEKEEERREKLREELIRESEKEQEKKGSVDNGGSGGKKSLAKSRSRSRLRKKKGKK